MQRFINNWSAPLLVAAPASATLLTVAESLAEKLVGLGSGDHYLLTAVKRDEAGAEVAWEVIRVTGQAGGELTVVRAQEGTTALELEEGETVRARLTAGACAAFAASGLTKTNFIQKMTDGSSGNDASLLSFWDAEIGELLLVEPSFATPLSGDLLPGLGGYLVRGSSDGADAGLSVIPGALVLHAGTEAGAVADATVGAEDPFAALAVGRLGVAGWSGLGLDDGIASAGLTAAISIPQLSTSTEEYSLRLAFSLAGVSAELLYDRQTHGPNWVVRYQDQALEEHLVSSSLAVVASEFSPRYASFTLIPNGTGHDVKVAVGSSAFPGSDVVLATLPAEEIAPDGWPRLRVRAELERRAGSAARVVHLGSVIGAIQLA